MQAYLNQEFPLGPDDLRLHAVDPLESATGGPGYWRVARALLS